MPGEIVLEPLPFEEAIDYFVDRVPVTKKGLKKLSKDAQKNAFTVATEQKMQVITSVKESIEKALKEGVSMGQFKRDLNALFDTMGVTRLGSHHAETVFRNSIQTAYSVGRYKKQTHPEVLAERPYGEYDAVDDGETTDLCNELDDRVYPMDHPFWDSFYPPNHHNCRSRVNTVSKLEVKREGLKIQKETPGFFTSPSGVHAPLIPGKGFEKNPALGTGYEPDWSKYPTELIREAQATPGGTGGG